MVWILFLHDLNFISPFLYPSGFFSNQVGNNKMKAADFVELQD